MQRICQLFILFILVLSAAHAQGRVWNGIKAGDGYYSPDKQIFIIEFGEKAAAGTKMGDAILQAQREFQHVQAFNVADAAKLRSMLDASDAGAIGIVILIRPPASQEIAELPGRYPDMAFTIIDGEANHALNVQNVEFKEQKGAFLLGAIAAIHTTDRITVMALETTPRATRLEQGFIAGVRHVRPDAEITSMMNVRPSATQHTRLSSTISSSFQEGTAIIFSMDDEIVEQALRAAKPERKIVISANAPTGSMDLSRMMTFMVKRYDLALLDILHIYSHKQWHPGSIQLGVSGGYLDYSLNGDNVEIFPKDSIDQIEAIKDHIGQGLYGVESD